MVDVFTSYRDNSRKAVAALLTGRKHGLEAVADQLVALAQQKAPVATGKLRDSIKRGEMLIGDKGVASVEVRVEAPYGHYVEYGTGVQSGGQKVAPGKLMVWLEPGIARPAPDDLDAWRRLKADGKVHYATSTEGQVAQPYFRPAVDEVRLKILAPEMRDAMQDQLLSRLGRPPLERDGV